MSSVNPSEKYVFCAEPLRSTNGSTAIERSRMRGAELSPRRGDVDRPADRVHHADQVLFPLHQDAPGKEVPRIEAADIDDSEHPRVVDEPDVKPDLVDMADNHDLLRLAAGPGRLDSAHQIAHGIDARLIEKPFGFPQNQLANALLPTRRVPSVRYGLPPDF